ncbi:hypothetical protein ACFVMA_13965 [Streptomyces rochei]|uniref:hypothetical protein n=1 Tax=Streptomyces rochei TaxID=1928 RepID=UPI00369CCB50
MFVAGLDYRGKAPDKQQRQQLCALVADALAGDWSEKGLRRYLDISDAGDVRSAAGLYIYRLHPDRIPTAAEAEQAASGLPPIGPDCYHAPEAATDVSKRVDPISGAPCPACHPAAKVLPPACETCLRFNPAAATDVSLRIDPTSWDSKPCPKCHPAVAGQAPELPPACQACIDANPASRTNPRFRIRVIDDNHQPCPDCHPKRVATGARATAHTADAYTSSSVDDLFGPRLKGTDAKVAGWMALSRQLAAEEQEHRPGVPAPRPQIAPSGHKPYRNPTDQSVYRESFFGGYEPYRDPADDSVYDKDL